MPVLQPKEDSDTRWGYQITV